MDNSSKLNSLDQYSQLIQLSKRIGFEVTKVVFRGYHTSNQLQRLHEQAVEKRTALKVKMEAEQQTQDLTDSKLLNEQQRNILRTLKVSEDDMIFFQSHSQFLKLRSIDAVMPVYQLCLLAGKQDRLKWAWAI